MWMDEPLIYFDPLVISYLRGGVRCSALSIFTRVQNIGERHTIIGRLNQQFFTGSRWPMIQHGHEGSVNASGHVAHRSVGDSVFSVFEDLSNPIVFTIYGQHHSSYQG